MSEIVATLRDRELVIEDGSSITSEYGGRPGTAIRLNPRGASFLGAEFTKDHVSVLAMSLDGNEITRVREPIADSADMDAIVNQLCRLVRRVRSRAGADFPNLIGLGVAIPGLVKQRGETVWLPDIHWRGVGLSSRLSSQLRIPVVIDNDANAAALAELLFAPEETASSFIYVLLDTGVGTALVLNEALYRGADGIGGESGRMQLDPAGPACHCGRIGCFEMLASKAALARYYTGRHASSVEEIIMLAQREDKQAESAVSEWLGWVARGMANLIFILNPSHVIFGGGLAASVPGFVDRLEPLLWKEGIEKPEGPQLLMSKFSENNGAVGGAALVYQSMFQVPVGDPGDARVIAQH